MDEILWNLFNNKENIIHVKYITGPKIISYACGLCIIL
jgi:hypothetical protein